MMLPAYRIDSSLDGFAAIGRIYTEIREMTSREIEIDCQRLTWLGANMCAPLGAIMAGRRPRYVSLSENIEDILTKNQFLAGSRTDRFGTTITFQEFKRDERARFEQYIEHHFRGKGLPRMTSTLLRRFRESLFELFENAVAHSDTRLGIFACGQFFPKKNELHFCIADRGVGIPARVGEFLRQTIRPCDAIEWAMSKQNTTRLVQDGLPGGLGLKLIREFIELNGGAIRVASDTGYWSFRGKTTSSLMLPHGFPGTAVDIEINTADTKSYALIDEFEQNEIF